MPTATLDMNGWIDEEDDGTYTVLVKVTGLPDHDIAEAVSFWLRDLVNESSGKMDGPITFRRDA
jgi:hypothetical protein